MIREYDLFLERVAQEAVEVLGIKEGHLVEVRANMTAHKWAEAIALAVEGAGAVPFLNLTSLEHEVQRIRSLPLARLSQPSPVVLEMARRTDAVIVVERDWSQLGRLCSAEGLAAWHQAIGVLVEQQESRRVPYCLIAHPDAVPESALLVSRAALDRALQAALAADPDETRIRVERLAARLGLDRKLEIRSGNGCRLTFGFEGRIIGKGDGGLRENRVVNFPFGSVFVAPVEGTVEGSIYIRRWQRVEGLVLTFSGGRLCDVRADRNVDHFVNLLNTHTGDKDRVSHIGIGVNPSLTIYTGHTPTDECISGSIFLALGENRYMGGANASTLNLDLICQRSTVLQGEEALVAEGQLLI